ncbi:MAG: S-adenosylmethionine decarboxylase proenzyme [Candidatus Aminicenantes bacterium]|nr:S-adenosylmethionine decarboxylase proenzyme [Candidatus Aminicenantes bacterium]NIM78559.1 S-adenosylmethionine decarboxylase proenzyme [Candidatus Aminicenantes bacterium]NIN17805.1 S-adenosylmethionine decarboxylase proenzyme [Candidatus Aminicenantes bacterium]NIN41709.1 S-adenosylmethionine decarboxylase proenzyme [Candidatus Aminicenantes bacterium]NIN84458.1 S-adenosylmethionine decarboxylase proenzyme [Candidatus Aminicenantes bacterium]
MQSLGNHLIVELYDCRKEIINDARSVEKALIEAVRISGARMIQSVVHEFNPHGISGVIVIEESHFSVHTWPEYGYCALDIFTCGDEIDHYSALQYLKKEFQAKNLSVTEMKRGMLDLPVKLLHKPESEFIEGKNAKRAAR